MEQLPNQGPIQTQQPIPQPPIPPQSSMPPSPPIPQPANIQPPPVEHKSNKKMLFVLLILIVILGVLAGIFYILNSQSTPTPADRTTTPTVASPTPEALEEEKQLESIDLGDLESDLQGIQVDVEQL